MSPAGRARLFGHGDLRLYLLRALEEAPRHGYELMRLLEDRFLGLYAPSAGTVYPRLAAMEEDGLVASDEAEGRRVYRLTDAGREELDNRRFEVNELEARVARSARDLAREIREDVRASVRDLRQEIRGAARDVRREERRGSYEAREAAREARHAGKEAGRAAQRAVRSIQADLQSFASDVSAAARRHRLDPDRLGDLREALLEARTVILEALEGRRSRPTDAADPPAEPDPPRFDRGDLPPHC